MSGPFACNWTMERKVRKAVAKPEPCCFDARESGMASLPEGSHACMKESFGGGARSGTKCYGVEASISDVWYEMQSS